MDTVPKPPRTPDWSREAPPQPLVPGTKNTAFISQVVGLRIFTRFFAVLRPVGCQGSCCLLVLQKLVCLLVSKQDILTEVISCSSILMLLCQCGYIKMYRDIVIDCFCCCCRMNSGERWASLPPTLSLPGIVLYSWVLLWALSPDLCL